MTWFHLNYSVKGNYIHVVLEIDLERINDVLVFEYFLHFLVCKVHFIWSVGIWFILQYV